MSEPLQREQLECPICMELLFEHTLDQGTSYSKESGPVVFATGCAPQMHTFHQVCISGDHCDLCMQSWQGETENLTVQSIAEKAHRIEKSIALVGVKAGLNEAEQDALCEAGIQAFLDGQLPALPRTTLTHSFKRTFIHVLDGRTTPLTEEHLRADFVPKQPRLEGEYSEIAIGVLETVWQIAMLPIVILLTFEVERHLDYFQAEMDYVWG